MRFNSPQYAAFLAVVVLANYVCPRRARWILCLVASYAFCAWSHPLLPFTVALSTVLSFGAARFVPGRAPRLCVAIGLGGNLTLLLAFKYLTPGSAPLAAIGVSFFTLQAIGYLLDVSRGLRRPEENFGTFALFMAFFPQVVSGPIARSGWLLPQLHSPRTPGYEDLSRGLRQLMWGLFQKMVVADNLGMLVDSVYGDVRAYTGFPLLNASLFFAVQLYADFAGYSNVAIGSARLLGFELQSNFDRPYAADSIAEFWRRWHMSLSKWLADYVYTPLSVALRGWHKAGLAASVVVTFLICGLWHGATSNFAAWGLFHGAGLSALALTRPLRSRLERSLGRRSYGITAKAATLLFVGLAWVLFRTSSLGEAAYVYRHAFDLDFGTLIGVPTISRSTFVRDLILIGVATAGDCLRGPMARLEARVGSSVLNVVGLALLGLGLWIFGVFEKQAYIYTQF